VQAPLYIGYANGEYFDGAMDDVRIYNRALSTNEVAQLFQYEAAKPGPAVALIKAVSH
jgi:hypothetical protein